MLIPFHSLVSEDWGSPVLRIWYFFFLLGHGFGFCELGFPPILRIWYFFFPTRAWFYSIWYLIHVIVCHLPFLTYPILKMATCGLMWRFVEVQVWSITHTMEFELCSLLLRCVVVTLSCLFLVFNRKCS